MGNSFFKNWFKKDFSVLIMGLNASGKKTIIHELMKLNLENRVHCKHNIDALVYVLDSTDRERLEQAIDRLARYMDEDELRDIPIAIMANKQDLPNAMEPTEIYNKIWENSRMRLRDWAVFGVSGFTGDGLLDCIDWLSKEVSKFKGLRSTKEPMQVVFDAQTQEDTNNNMTENIVSKDVSKLFYLKNVVRSCREMLCSK